MNEAHVMQSVDEAARRRRVRRMAIVLSLVAAAFYVGFILLAVTRGIHG